MSPQVREEILWQRHPSWKGMILWYARWGGVTCAVLLLVGLAAVGGAISWTLFVLAALVGLGGVYGIGRLIRKTTIFTISNMRVSEKYGILNTTKEQARLDKITNITVTRTLTERILGIGQINIDTASDAAPGKEDVLQWWGIENPYAVEHQIDSLRIEAEDEILRAKAARTAQESFEE